MSNLEPFDLEDVEKLLNMIDEAHKAELTYPTDLRSATTIDITQINLEELATSLHGITDPIGQLTSWLYDRLKELSSWFASTVESIFRSVWDTVISPAITAIRSVADSIWSYIQRIPGTVTDMLTYIRNAIAGSWDWIQKNVLTPLSNVLSTLATSVQNVVSSLSTFLTTTLPNLINQAIKSVQDIGTSVWNWIQSNIINPLAKAIGSLIERASAGVEVLASFFTKDLPTYLSQIPKAIQDLGATAWNWIQTNIISPLSSAISGVLDAVKKGIDVVTSFITKDLPSFLASIPKTIQDLASSAWNWIQANIITPIGNALSGFINMIQSGLSTISSAIASIPKLIQDLISSTWSWIQSNVITPLGSALTSFINAVKSGLDSVLSFFTKTLPEFLGKAWDMIQSGVKGVWDWIQANLITPIGNALTSFMNTIKAGLDSVLTFFSKTLPDWFGKAWDAIQSGLKGAWDWIQKYVISPISDAFSKFIEWIKGGIDTLATFFTKTLPSWLSSAWDSIQGGIKGVWNWIQSNLITPLASAFDTFIKTIQSGITTFTDFLTKTLPSQLASVAKALSELPTTAFEALKVAGMTIWDYITKLGTTVTDGFAKVGAILDTVAKSLTQVGVYLTGFVNAVTQLPERLYALFKGVVDAFGYIKDFFTNLWNELVKFTQNPAEWLKTNLLDPLVSTLQWLGSKIWEGLNWLWDMIKKGASWLYDRLKDFATWVATGFSDIMKELLSGIMKFFEQMGLAFKSVYEQIAKFFVVPLETITNAVSGLKDVFANILKSVGISSPPYLTPGNILSGLVISLHQSVTFAYMMVIAQVIPRAMAYGFRFIGMTLPDFLKEIELRLAPLSLGLAWRFDPARAIGSAFYSAGEELSKMLDKWMEYTFLGMLFGYGALITRFTTYNLRNFIPIELPSLEEVLESARRFRVAEKIPAILGKSYDDIYDGLKYYLEVRGYSDYVVKSLIAKEDELYMTIKDRFEQTRTIPLSLMYRLPPPSEVARMIIKDVIIPPSLEEPGQAEALKNTIKKLFMVAGMNEHLASIYFLMHFRYPTPATLARFYWRAMAGLTWLDQALVEPEILNAFGFERAVKAVPPTQLNFQAEMLNYAMTKYLRWMDYLPGTWIPGFTSDSSIILELTADLPRRIDIRWLGRWGIFEHLAKLGWKMEEPPSKIVELMKGAKGTELLQEKVTPTITLDVSVLARLLEGAGYHPYWVPALSVAWIHQVLSDELTLLRTGFLNAFKEGLITLDLSEKLMSGLFVISFTTGYISTATGDADVFEYRKPVLWLPAERRLLQLRMVFDRHIDLTRDMLREVTSGLRRLALTEDDAKKIFKDYFSLVAKHWSAEVKAVSGVDWTPTIDESYLELWYEYASRLRGIEKKMWVRNYISRVIGWLMYRVSYGWLEQTDYENLLNTLLNARWITDEEHSFFIWIFKWLSGIVAKEYIPTPLTLATFAEYMVIDESVINKVFEKQRVPEDFRSLYKTYISVRPIKSDYKSLLSTARRAFRSGVIKEEDWKKYLDKAKQYGFSDIETNILQEIADLEIAIESSREYLPTPQTLATLSEYMTLSEDLVRSVLEARKLPKDWIDIWIQYITVRPVKSDYKSLLTTASRALVLNVIDAKTWDSYKSRAKQYGFTDVEIDLLDERVKLEEKLDNVRRYRQLFEPTPSFIATILEYVDTSEIEGFSKYLDSFFSTLSGLGVDQAVITAVKTYITSRPVKSDYRTLLTTALRAYRIGVIDDKKWNEYLTNAKQYGFTKREIDILTERASLELMIESYTEYLPSPTTLATLSEYMTLPPDLVKKTLEERKLPKEWVDIWLNYIRVKPVKQDYKALLTTASRAYVLNILTSKEWSDYKAKAKDYGFTDIEVSLIDQMVELEEKIDVVRRYRELFMPSVSFLATLSEYVDVLNEPKFASYLQQFYATLKNAGVPQDVIDVVSRYLSVRPVKSDYRALLVVALRAYREGVIKEDEWKNYLADAVSYGFTKREVDILVKRAELEILIEQTREYLPTPSTLATLSEYIQIPEDVIKQVLEARRVPKDWQEIWIRYIRIRPLADDIRALVSAYYRAIRYGVDLGDLGKQALDVMKSYGFTEEELKIRSLAVSIEEAVNEYIYIRRLIMPSPQTLATISEYVDLPTDFVKKTLDLWRLPQDWYNIWLSYVSTRPVKSDYKSLLSVALRAYRLGVLSESDWNKYVNNAVNYGFTPREVDILIKRAELEVLIEQAREYLPTPQILATLSEYMTLPPDLIKKTLELRKVPKEWVDIWVQYITVRPVKPDYKSLLTTASRAYIRNVIGDKEWSDYKSRAKQFGFTDVEISLIDERVKLEMMVEEAREYVPTLTTLASMSEYVVIPQDIIQKVFTVRRVPKDWQPIWLNYIQVRPLADDARALLTSYLRALRYGATIPEDIAKQVNSVFAMVGITKDELSIRELALTLDAIVEAIPTLSQLATMSEYIEVPTDYIVKILTARRVEKTFADLWLKYISVRTISSEVNTLVATVRRIYEYFTLSEDLYKQVKDIMKSGGWTDREITIFETDLVLRKAYRIFTYLIPTVRQFVTDGQYLPNYMTLIEDLIKARGIEVDKYKQQVEYYKKLLKNRRIWRHFSWWRTRLMNAYANGAITLDQVKQKLQKFKDLGLIDDDEIQLIFDGLELQKAYVLSRRR